MTIVNYPLAGGGNRHNNPTMGVIHAMGEWIVVDKQQSIELKKSGYPIEPGDYFAPTWLQMLNISAHYMVAPSGVIIQCRPEELQAWHAREFNTNSLGVEFLVPGKWHIIEFESLMRSNRNYLTHTQWDSGVQLARDWHKNRGIKEFKRHSDLSPGRKFDPGNGFPWEKYIDLIFE